MAAPNVYVPNAVKFPTGNTLHQIESIPVDSGFEPLVIVPAGGFTPGFSGFNVGGPVVPVSTTQIFDLLTYLATENIAAGGLLTDIDLEYQQIANVSTRTAQTSASHVRLRANAHLTVLNAIVANDGEPAVAEFTIYAISSAGVAPLVYSGSVAITGSPVVQALYTLGPVDVDGTDICVDSWRLDINPQMRIKRCSGFGWPEFASCETSRPTLTITSDDVEENLNHIDDGAAVTTMDFYLRKKLAGGINVPNGTAEHIKFTATTAARAPRGPREMMFYINSWSRNLTSAIT